MSRLPVTLVSLVFLLCVPVFAPGKPRHAAAKTVPDNFRALALDKQKLTGLFGSRIRANSEGFLENIDLEELLRPLQVDPASSESESLHAARGFAGQFLDAAADAFEYNHDLQLRTQMDKVAAALGALIKAATALPDAELTEASLVAARSDLLGLLAHYRVTGEPGSYATAQTIGTQWVKLLSSTQTATSLSQAGLIEPLVRLYRRSGERRYLDLCLTLARGFTIPEITGNTPQATLVSVFSALRGFADLYEATGDATYLRAGIDAWKQILTLGRLSTSGAPLPPAGESDTIDACVAASWLQFTFKLLRVTGEPMYGDQLERSIYNQIFASQDARNGNISAEVPLNGSKLFSGKLQAGTGTCMLSEAKALALLPQLVWGRCENGIAINLYTPGRAFFTLRKHGLVQIYSEGAFPQTGQLQLHVEPSKRAAQFPLRLRVPSWAGEFNVDIADLHLKGRSGDVVIIDREWKSGDTVRVSMALPLSTPTMTVGYAGDLSMVARVLQRGPQVLALGKPLNTEIQDLSSAAIRPLASGRYQISDYTDRLPRDFAGDQVYRIAGEVLGKGQELLLVPFADAFNYRTFLQPSPSKAAAK